MKKIITYTLLLIGIALSSCESTIETMDFKHERYYSIYAVLNTAGTNNRIICYLKKEEEVQYDYGTYDGETLEWFGPDNEAQIKIYVNGELKESNPEYDGYNHCYPISTIFQPGDKVRIEVNSPNAQGLVWAEAEAPMPIEVTKADAIKTVTSIDNGEPQEYYKMNLQMKATNGTNPCCRLVSGIHYDILCGVARVENDFEKIEEHDSLLSEDHLCLLVKDDMGLTDGRGYLYGEMDDMFGSENFSFNHFRAISNSYFSNGQYNASVLVDPIQLVTSFDHDWYSHLNPNIPWLDDGIKYIVNTDEHYKPTHVIYDKGTAHRKLYYQVYAISEEEYLYLKARSNQMDIDWHEPMFPEPVVLKGNINGGRGFFAIETVTEGIIEIANTEN